MTETDTVLRPGAAAGGAKGRHPALWLVLVLLLLLFAPTLWWLWERWTLSVWNNGHGILIAGLVAWLVWGELKKCRELPTDSSALGFLILIPALAAHMLDTGIDTKLLSAAAMFAALPGLSLLFLGVERTKRILFPLLLLFLTLPIPLVFTEKLHLVLRQITTEGVSFLLPLLGVPVFASGTLLETPNGLLEVADSCSGFSTLYAAITVSLLVAYTTPDPRRKILVLLVAAPLAIVINIIRVLMLALLVDWYGIDILATSMHEISGLLAFVIALPLIFWIGHTPAPGKEER